MEQRCTQDEEVAKYSYYEDNSAIMEIVAKAKQSYKQAKIRVIYAVIIMDSLKAAQVDTFGVILGHQPRRLFFIRAGDVESCCC